MTELNEHNRKEFDVYLFTNIFAIIVRDLFDRPVSKYKSIA